MIVCCSCYCRIFLQKYLHFSRDLFRIHPFAGRDPSPLPLGRAPEFVSQTPPSSLRGLGGLSGKVPGLPLATKKARDPSDTDQTPFPAAGALNHVPQALRPRRGRGRGPGPEDSRSSRDRTNSCCTSSQGCWSKSSSRLVLQGFLRSASSPQRPGGSPLPLG